MSPAVGNESRDDFYAYELVAAAHKLVTEVRPVSAGQQVLVSVDSAGDSRVAHATAAAVHALGAEVAVITYPTQPEPMMMPPRAVAQAALGVDIWFDFAVGYQLYSPAFHEALKNDCIYVTLTGMDVDMMVRTIGRVKQGPLDTMAVRLYELSQEATTIRVTNPAGTDLRMTVDKAGDPIFADPPVKGFPQMLGGQSWPQVYRESFNGRLVFDGAVWPPAELGVVRNPVAVTVADGYVQSFEGGAEAKVYERYLRGFGHKEALLVDHACYGFNPGVLHTSGRILEDERVFGCTQFGIGATAYGSPIHTDGVVLESSIWFDSEQIADCGRYVHPELAELCRAMDVAGY
jgi:leucyl aminopeptidase (aminopeptidase T)